jgi:2,4-dienoyl-CoA reductase-like NADH-dependent reductase (Old Yellow Enzyme family)/thioredoxin reductase
MTEKLFEQGTIGPLTLKNRLVMTAMGNALGAEDGSVTEAAIQFYAERARGGLGLIITECMIINWANGRGNLHQTGVHTDEMIPGLTRLASAVHDAGARIVAQIYHPGRQGFTLVNGTESMPAPSDIKDAMTQQDVHAMSVEEIEELIILFADAALRLKKAGFDGAEIHAAHGYLLNSFLSPYSNQRDDAYGGDVVGRTLIVRKIIEAIRAACGDEFAILVRISVNEFLEVAGKPGQGILPDEGVLIAQALESAGCDAIDASSGIYETMNTAWEPFSYEEGWKISLAAEVKSAVSIPVIGVSVIRNPEFAEKLLQEEKLDFVGSARAHFADPFWSQKAQSGSHTSIRRCVSCLACMETLVAADMTNEPAACAINPKTGRETLDRPAQGDGKLVVVVGAGPAGLEAAVTAAENGYKVILLEKADRIGGQLNYASQPPGKDKINWIIAFYEERILALDIELQLNTEATVDYLAKLNPSSVIVATGSIPILPGSIPGLTQDDVYLPSVVLTGEVDLSGLKVAVVGSGMTGIETTDFLAEQGCELSLYEMAPDIGPGIYFQNMMDIMPKLGAHGVKFFPSHKLLGIEGKTARFEQEDGTEVSDDFDAFVISLGTRPDSATVSAIQGVFPNAIAVGDSNKPGRIMNATSDGWQAIYKL